LSRDSLATWPSFFTNARMPWVSSRCSAMEEVGRVVVVDEMVGLCYTGQAGGRSHEI
jgi:hypothetical protein